MNNDYIEPYVYEGENFDLKHDDDNNIIIEFNDRNSGINKEYPVHNMDMDDIEREKEYDGGWNINFLPKAKIYTKWKYITFNDNTSGFDITDEETGETKFYSENHGGFDCVADDGEVIYVAAVINMCHWPNYYIVGFVKKEDLDPNSEYYPDNWL